MNDSIAIQVKDLEKFYGKVHALRGVDLEVKRGEVYGFLGPNGAGKTTSFYMIVGIIKPDAGTIHIDGEEFTGEAMYLRCRKGISYLPQEASIFRDMTVEENLDAILETVTSDSGAIEKERESLLKRFKIGHVRRSKGYMLSGGERRRVEIARALITRPSFLLLDEPFAGIDPIAVGEIQDLINDLRRSGLGILITDHNVRETLSITDRSYILSQGRILVSGTPGELIENETAKKIYLGEKFRL